MAQSTVSSTHSSLPDAFSSAVTEIFETTSPGIVQVHVEQRGGGTGVVWSTDGRIITNNHVVASDQAGVRVLFKDGRTFDARVLNRNPELDLALLKIEGDGFTALSVADSAHLRVGEWVFAIGHPWGQRWAVTAGIVNSISSIKLRGNGRAQYIKSDVGLAPGNSGGPLLNADGQVVGINAMIFGGDLSVSIPSNVVTQWLANLPKEQGRGILGVEIQTVALPTPLRQQLRRDTGVLIVGTGLRQAQYQDLFIGDVLLEVAGTPVYDPTTLRAAVARAQGNSPLSVKVLRAGKIVALDLSLVTVEKAA